MWVAEEVTESLLRAEQAALFLLQPSPANRITMQGRGFPHPGEYLRLCPLLHNRHAETKKYGPNERTEKIQLSDG